MTQNSENAQFQGVKILVKEDFMESSKTARELYQTSYDCYHTGLFETSLEWIEQAIDANNKELNYFQLRGMILIKLNLYEKALKDFDWVIQRLANTKLFVEEEKLLQVEALLGRIQIYFQQKEYEGLIQDSNALLLIQRNHWQAFFYRGIGYYFNQTYAQALNDLDMAFYLSNQQDKVRPFRALAYFKHGKYALAQKDFEIAVKQKPHDGVLWYNYGLNAYRMQQFELALQNFDQALRLGLATSQTYLYKGKALQQLGRYTEAEKCRLKAQEI
ncbi:hypothetical protein BKI52_35720 [marine bacterium AO1-C]|nr:hypothetical protein BKI52_35720 [marine bacterium AO1-C]